MKSGNLDLIDPDMGIQATQATQIEIQLELQRIKAE